MVVGYNLRYSFFKEVLCLIGQDAVCGVAVGSILEHVFPQPSKDDGWFGIGELRDGTPIDVYRLQLGEVFYEKPDDPSAYYQTSDGVNT